MTLSNEQVMELANRHGLKLDAASLVYNESGLDFQVVFARDLAGTDWVLRIPRREYVAYKTKREKGILDLVEKRGAVQAPVWEIYSNVLIAYKLLKGIPAGTIDPEAGAYVWQLDEKNVPDTYHDTLGQLMASLHQIDHEEAREAGLPVLTPDELKASMEQRMEKVKAAFGVGSALWLRWQRWLDNDAIWPERTVLVHGDLHPGHILIDEQARVTGVIDWTEARVDDPAYDFGAHLIAFGDQALKKLIQSYQHAGGYVWPGMAEHIGELMASSPVAIAEFALESGLETYEAAARQALELND
jgi:macrolide phosphotransferase